MLMRGWVGCGGGSVPKFTSMVTNKAEDCLIFKDIPARPITFKTHHVVEGPNWS